MIKVAIGSVDSKEIEIVRKSLEDYDFLKGFSLEGVAVISGVPKQPLNYREALLGAQNRAVRSYAKNGNSDYGIGIEFGISRILIPNQNLVAMGQFLCAVYDGDKNFYGFSSSFQIPDMINRKIGDTGSIKLNDVLSGGVRSILGREITLDNLIGQGLDLAVRSLLRKDLFSQQ